MSNIKSYTHLSIEDRKINVFVMKSKRIEKLESCELPKYFYISEMAQREYKSKITIWKEGPKKNNIEMKEINDILKQGVKNGQSIDVMINTNQLSISTATAYRYIENRYIEGICNIDLKRKVKYATRTKSKPKPVPMNYDFLESRRFMTLHSCLQIINISATYGKWILSLVRGPMKSVYSHYFIVLLIFS